MRTAGTRPIRAGSRRGGRRKRGPAIARLSSPDRPCPASAIDLHTCARLMRSRNWAARSEPMKRALACLLLACALSAFAADPSPSPAPADLAVYAGRYPVDPVDGVSFLHHPRV